MPQAQVQIAEPYVPNDDRRNGSDRVAIGQPSTIRTDNFAPRDIVVEDLSSSGFLFRSDDHLAVGTCFHIGLSGGGMTQARVVRAQNGQYGCEFDVPLTEQQLTLAFTAQSVVPGTFAAYHTAPLVPYREDKWPGAVRVGILVGGGAFSWLLLWQAASLLFG